jgi:hypothetical protein
MRRELASLALLAVACGRTDLDRGAGWTVTPAAGGQAGSSARGGSGGQAGAGGQAGVGGRGGAGGQAGSSGATGGGGKGGGTSTLDAGVVPGSCREILNAGLSTGDGIYFIRVGASPPISVQCLMSLDGGGWTLVGNFPWPGSTAGVPGWTSGAAVGSSFTDLARPFKLSDADINALRTYGFRAQGTASYCMLEDGVSFGPCAIDTLLFWRATCNYASGSNSSACSTSYRDAAFATRGPGGTPCAWHFGLTSANCDTLSTMGTSHSGDHVFVGEYQSLTHAYDGRPKENPSVRFWVR